MRVLKMVAVCAWLIFITGCTLIKTGDPGEKRSEKIMKSVSKRMKQQVPVPGSPFPFFMARTDESNVKADQGKLSLLPEPKISKQTLTLSECLKIALEQNPATQSSWRESLSTATKVGEEASAYWPDLEVTSSAIRSDTAAVGSVKDQGAISTYEAGLGVHYLLLDGGTRKARVDKAKGELLAANLNHNAVIQDLAFQVKEAYYNLLAAGWQVLVSQDTLEQAQRHEEIARARHRSGLVIRSDVLKAETQKAQANLALIHSRSLERITQGQLARAMGLRINQSFHIEDIPDDLHEQEIADIDSLLEEALRRRPEALSWLAREKAAEAELQAEKSRSWPTMTADASLGLRDDLFFPESEQWTVGVGLRWPIFTGFERTYRLDRAESDLAKARAEYRKAIHSVELEVWTAYVQTQEADETTRAARMLVKSARESARAAEAEYKNGTGTIIELIDAQNSLSSAKAQHIQARLDWYKALAGVERAVGRNPFSKGFLPF